MERRRQTHALAIMVPAVLLGGALVAEFGFGLPPCEMCWWQRYGHIAALILGLAAWQVASDRLTRLAAAAIAGSGLIGGFHAGVEYGWWEGLTRCSTSGIAGDPLSAIMNAPLVRCDVAPWDWLGVSLAGWNFLISLAAAGTILLLLSGRAPRLSAA